jgi:hypothetical protein
MWYSVEDMEKQIIRRKPETKDLTIKFRLPEGTYNLIKDQALRERRTMGSQALYFIERGIESGGLK